MPTDGGRSVSDAQYADYLGAASALAGLDARLAADDAQALAARQSSMEAAYARARDTERAIAQVRDTVRRAESRASALTRSYPVPSTAMSNSSPQDFMQLREMLAGIGSELDGIDTADAWLRRAKQQLAQAEAALPAPVPTPAPPRVAQANAAPPAPAIASASAGMVGVAASKRGPVLWWSSVGALVLIVGAMAVALTHGG